MSRYETKEDRIAMLKGLLENAEERDKFINSALKTHDLALDKCEELKKILIDDLPDYPLEISLITLMIELLNLIEEKLDSGREWCEDDIEHNNQYIEKLKRDIEREEE